MLENQHTHTHTHTHTRAVPELAGGGKYAASGAGFFFFSFLFFSVFFSFRSNQSAAGQRETGTMSESHHSLSLSLSRRVDKLLVAPPQRPVGSGLIRLLLHYALPQQQQQQQHVFFLQPRLRCCCCCCCCCCGLFGNAGDWNAEDGWSYRVLPFFEALAITGATNLFVGVFFCIFFYICSYFVWQPPPTQTIGSGQNELAFPFHGQLDFFKNNPKIDSSFSRLPERISNRFDKVFDWKAFRPLDWLIFGSSDDQFNHLFSDFFWLWYRRLPSVDGFSFLRNGMERRFFLWKKKKRGYIILFNSFHGRRPMCLQPDYPACWTGFVFFVSSKKNRDIYFYLISFYKVKVSFFLAEEPPATATGGL